MIDPFARKLRFSPGVAAWIDIPPDGVELGAALMSRRDSSPGFVLVFLRRVADVDLLAVPGMALATGDAVVWLAYPKKSSPLFEDLSRDHGWGPVEAAAPAISRASGSMPAGVGRSNSPRTVGASAVRSVTGAWRCRSEDMASAGGGPVG